MPLDERKKLARQELELLKKQIVDVIVSDQRMPLMQGVDLLRQAREISPVTMRLSPPRPMRWRRGFPISRPACRSSCSPRIPTTART